MATYAYRWTYVAATQRIQRRTYDNNLPNFLSDAPCL